jgi:hypothetical protein
MMLRCPRPSAPDPACRLLRGLSCLPVILLVAIPVVLSVVVSVWGSAQAAPMKDRIEVRLVLYSGRPDPSWMVTQPEAIAHIKQSLQGLPEAPLPQWPILGWRGFLLNSHSPSLLPGIVRVFHGTVCVTDDNGRRCYVDRDHLEDWLRKEAVRNGLEPLLPPP